MKFWISAAVILALAFAATLVTKNEYFFFAGYVVVQSVILATAWNILGGYCGYVNFGSSGFFAIGAYTSVCLFTIGQSPEDVFPAAICAPSGRPSDLMSSTAV